MSLHDHYPPKEKDPRQLAQDRAEAIFIAKMLGCLVVLLLVALFISANRLERLEDQLSGVAYLPEQHL